jgi:HEAT repeat protein
MVRLYRIPQSRIDGNELATALVDRVGIRARVFDERVSDRLARVLIAFDELDAHVNVVDDDDAGGQYLEIEALHDDDADQLHAALCELVPERAFDDVLADAARDPRDAVLLARAAVASGNVPNEQLLALLRSSAGSDDPGVRRGAYHAAGMTQWPQAVPIVAAGLDDPAETNREYARRVFASLQAAGVVPGEH